MDVMKESNLVEVMVANLVDQLAVLMARGSAEKLAELKEVHLVGLRVESTAV